jgi:hypothetical protein
MPRIAPVTGKSDVPAEYHHVVDDVLDVFGSIRGPFSILLHSPKLAERLLKLVTFNREENVVEPKLRSVAILSAVREREAAYVCVDQAVFDRLKSRHDAQWMVELTEVANYFAFLSGMVNPFEVPAPPDGDKLPS